MAKKTVNIFPFTTRMPHFLTPTFRINDRRTWFEADVTVHDFTTVTFHVFDIDDPVFGGRGVHLRDVRVENVDGVLLLPLIKRRIREQAEFDFYAEKARQEKLVIDDMATEMLSTVRRVAGIEA